VYDEVPLNDPFGGWVYWSRVDPEVASKVDVFQGGGSDFYGDQALAGVIKIARRAPDSSLRIASDGGSLGSFDDAASGGWTLGPVHASGFFDVAATDGYILVPSNLRGSIDTPANSRHSSGELRLEGTWKRALLFVQGSGFGERRHNGTPLQNNDTDLFAVSGGADRELGGGSLVVRLDGSGQSYNQSFSSVALDRNSETLSRLQHVPAQQFGLRALWGRALGAHLVSFGGDFRQIRGVTQETIFTSGSPSSLVDAGGRQVFGGAFVQDAWKIASRLTLGATLRFDGWNNYDASSVTSPANGVELITRTDFRDRNAFAVDPRLSVLYRVAGNVSLFATGYRSFRAPRLNELYRAFRLGNVLTLANADLSAERLTGVDAGAGIDAGRFHGRATFFFARVTNPIANVTLNVTPTLITRQRQNAGALDSKGIQLTASTELHKDWSFRADYQFADSTITRFEPNPALVGKRVPQVPQHSFATSLTFHRAAWTAVLNGRLTSQQYEDDLNTFDLGGASSFDVYGSRKWNDHFETFVAAENILDQRDLIARTPTPNLSLPFSARVGVRISIGRELAHIN
jgi:outer membrane receptor protein involved in Fe transport